MKNLIIGISGFGLGAVTGFIVSKCIYTVKMNEFIDEVNEELDDIRKEYEEEETEKVKEQSEEEMEDEEIDLTPEKTKMEEIKEQLNRNHKETLNYSKMYKSDGSNLIPQEQEEPDDGEDIYPITRINEEAPNGFPIEVIKYYQYDDIYVMENDETIPEEDVSQYFGEWITLDGWDQNDDPEIIIVNCNHKTVYRVKKQEESYKMSLEK